MKDPIFIEGATSERVTWKIRAIRPVDLVHAERPDSKRQVRREVHASEEKVRVAIVREIFAGYISRKE